MKVMALTDDIQTMLDFDFVDGHHMSRTVMPFIIIFGVQAMMRVVPTLLVQ